MVSDIIFAYFFVVLIISCVPFQDVALIKGHRYLFQKVTYYPILANYTYENASKQNWFDSSSGDYRHPGSGKK